MGGKRVARVWAVVVALAVAGCASGGGPSKQTVGSLGGAALGGLLGAQFGSGTGRLAATALGVVAGGLVGSEIGKSMDETDRLQAERAQSQAYGAPIGQQIAWNNPSSGHYGTVTAVADGYDQRNNSYCRQFEQRVTIDGRAEVATGNACRQRDGTWKIID